MKYIKMTKTYRMKYYHIFCCFASVVQEFCHAFQCNSYMVLEDVGSLEWPETMQNVKGTAAESCILQQSLSKFYAAFI